MADPEVARSAAETGTTRAVASMHRAAQEHPGAILAVGNAPTALLTIVEEDVYKRQVVPQLVAFKPSCKRGKIPS